MIIIAKSHYTVVRNESCTTARVSVREHHNERMNENYFNADIVPERAAMNVHFHLNFHPDGTVESYQETIDRLLAEGKIVKHNFKPKSAIADEFVFDVNTDYFEQNGGYDYAVDFYRAAYELAVKEVGSEDYILSAVLHADERNKALSEKLGYDVFHYHLHVVYVPVVQKELKWTKRAGPELAGKVKVVIPQINHTEKWPRVKVGRGYINEYSKLQDRYHEHMRAAGFDGFERGERGSTAEHLEVLDYKIQQDKKRLGELDKQADQKAVEVERLTQATKVRANISATQSEIDAMAKPGKSGNNKIVANADWKRVSEMAKRCIILDAKIGDLQREIVSVKRDRDKWKTNYERLWAEVKPFIDAIRSAPQKLLAFIREHLPGKSKAMEER